MRVIEVSKAQGSGREVEGEGSSVLLQVTLTAAFWLRETGVPYSRSK